MEQTDPLPLSWWQEYWHSERRLLNSHYQGVAVAVAAKWLPAIPSIPGGADLQAQFLELVVRQPR